MRIEIALENGEVSVSSGPHHRGAPVDLTELEQQFVNIALSSILESPEFSEIAIIDQRSSNYKTLSLCINYDFLRFKITPRAKWFSMWVPKEIRNDPRFESVEKKNLIHWKIMLQSIDDAARYKDLILASAKYAKSRIDSDNL